MCIKIRIIIMFCIMTFHIINGFFIYSIFIAIII